MTISLTPSTTRTYNLGPAGKVKPWVVQAGTILGSLFNINNEGGWRPTDQFPDHPTGHAIDFMINQPNTSAGFAQGDALANYAVAHYQELGIKYIIWNHRYWDPKQGWGPYVQPGQGPHTDHVHITFNDQPGAWTGSNAVLTSAILTNPDRSGDNVAPPETCFKHIPSLNPVGGDWCLIDKVTARQVAGFGLIVIGGATVLVGVALIAVFTFKNSAMKFIIPKQVRQGIR